MCIEKWTPQSAKGGGRERKRRLACTSEPPRHSLLVPIPCSRRQDGIGVDLRTYALRPASRFGLRRLKVPRPTEYAKLAASPLPLASIDSALSYQPGRWRCPGGWRSALQTSSDPHLCTLTLPNQKTGRRWASLVHSNVNK